jgi:hypothetical protein
MYSSPLGYSTFACSGVLSRKFVSLSTDSINGNGKFYEMNDGI